MVPFVPKKIINEIGLGEELRRARQNKNLDIDAVSDKLKIRRSYLISLEAENIDALPSGLYGKNFLKKYADFLEIDPVLVANFLNSWQENETSNPFSQKVLARNKFLVFPKIIRNILLIITILAGISYLLFYFNKITTPPELIVIEPEKNMVLKESEITIKGWSDKEAEIKINGELILSDNEGNFLKLINLKSGINTLEISAKRKYSRENTIIRQILVE